MIFSCGSTPAANNPPAEVPCGFHELACALELNVSFAFAAAFYIPDLRFYAIGISTDTLLPLMNGHARIQRHRGVRTVNRGVVGGRFSCVPRRWRRLLPKPDRFVLCTIYLARQLVIGRG